MDGLVSRGSLSLCVSGPLCEKKPLSTIDASFGYGSNTPRNDTGVMTDLTDEDVEFEQPLA
jgi:hypothetical protein